MRKSLLGVALLSAVTASACAAWDAPAARVDGGSVEYDDVRDRLEILRQDLLLRELLNVGVPAAMITDHRAPAQLQADLLTLEIWDRILRNALDERDIEIPADLREAVEADLAQVREQLAAQGGELSSGGEELVRQIVERGAAQQALLRDTAGDDEARARLDEVFAGTDVEVNPRIGRWDPLFRAVVPPPGSAGGP